MKNETAKREIESLDHYLQTYTNDYSEESHMAMMMAIKALEQQPCEEQQTDNECANIIAVRNYLWSRIDLLRDEFGQDIYFDMFWEIARDIYNDVPHVVPKLNVDDISREREQSYMLGYEDASKKFRTEPSEDCISRHAVIQIIENKLNPCTDMFKCLEMSEIKEDVERLPSVTPQRPKGKWIEVDVRNCHATLKCSVCDRVITPTFTFGEYSYENIKAFYPYCHCGADMSGGGEDGEDSACD